MTEPDENDLTDDELFAMWERGASIEVVDTLVTSDLPWLSGSESRTLGAGSRSGNLLVTSGDGLIVSRDLQTRAAG